MDLGRVNTEKFYQGEKGLWASFTGKSTPNSNYNPFMLTQYLGKGEDNPKVGNGKYRGSGDECSDDFKVRVNWSKLDMNAAYEYNGRKYVTLDAVFKKGSTRTEWSSNISAQCRRRTEGGRPHVLRSKRQRRCHSRRAWVTTKECPSKCRPRCHDHHKALGPTSNPSSRGSGTLPRPPFYAHSIHDSFPNLHLNLLRTSTMSLYPSSRPTRSPWPLIDTAEPRSVVE